MSLEDEVREWARRRLWLPGRRSSGYILVLAAVIKTPEDAGGKRITGVWTWID